ncbi:MAG: type II and III secretion system protein family protein [Proteobacteria bacterium]|nr:type II and III secretion system protein family protein [Pseudomonadota bacterium]
MANGLLRRGGRIVAFMAAVAGSIAVAQAADRAADRAAAPQAPANAAPQGESNARFLPLGVGKSVVIDLPGDIKDVLVSDPKVANAVVRSSRRAYLIGVAVGQANVFFFDAEGRQLAGFDIAVTRNLNGVRAALRQMFPHADLRLDGVGDGVVLSGQAENATQAQQAYDIAARLVGDGAKVVNTVAVKGPDQVMLKVTVAEVQRDIIKQLGIDLNGSLGSGNAVVNFASVNPFSAFGQALSSSNTALTFKSVTATLRAMERAGVIRTLAEPTLTSISGETATFLAGGEFPIPSGLSCDTTKSPPICQPSISFKKFGVSLNFTPVVLAEGRISLKVVTEVSDLSNDNAMTFSLPGTTTTLTVPSIRVRRADSTVEIPSGGALAMAGMIQEQTKQQINGIPGLMQLPVLGPMFRSRDYVNRQTELMVLVTPFVVRAVAQKDLSRPDDGYADAADPAGILLGRLNRIYGVPRQGHPGESYRGRFGFILD